VTTGRRAVLLLFVLAAAFVAWWPAPGAGAASGESGRRAVLIVDEPMSFTDFMAQPEAQALARAGGAGLLSAPASVREAPGGMRQALLAGGSTAVEDRNLLVRAVRAAGLPVCVSTTAHPVFCAGPGLAVLAPAGLPKGTITTPPPPPTSVLVIRLSIEPTPAMTKAGDELFPVAMAQGPGPAGPAASSGPMRSLTSDTTRYPGMVAVGDVAPTILRYLGVPIPSAMTGTPMRVTGNEAPFALYHRQLGQRHIRIGVQLAELAFVVLGGLALIVVLTLIERGRRPSPSAAAGWRFLTLWGVALFIPVAAGGFLPHFTYAWAAVWILAWTSALAWVSARAPGRDAMSPLVFLGAAGLVFLAVDLALGSVGLRIPLLGGTMFDGSRYYGLPNAFESTLLASGLFVATRFEPLRGGVLLFGCGLLAGFPNLGADVGGAIVLFAAAGLWWQLRSRGRLRWREAAVAFGVVVAGLAVVLVVNRLFAPEPTHITRFVETGGSSVTSRVDVIGHRLAAGFRQVGESPASLIPLLGLPLVLWAGLRARRLASALASARPWREVLIVLVLAAAVGFLVNDTGMAAAAPSFLYALAVLAFPSLTESAADGASPEAARSAVHAR
jgi:hypothetical protein